MDQPGWVDRNVHDPGWPLLQLLTFLQEQLLSRTSGRRRGLIAVGVATAVGLAWWRRRGDD
jgi:hypothetical protein